MDAKNNLDKCEFIIFRSPVNETNTNIRMNFKSFIINIGNKQMCQSSTAQYLGIHMHKLENFNKHVKVPNVVSRGTVEHREYEEARATYTAMLLWKKSLGRKQLYQIYIESKAV